MTGRPALFRHLPHQLRGLSGFDEQAVGPAILQGGFQLVQVRRAGAVVVPVGDGADEGQARQRLGILQGIVGGHVARAFRARHGGRRRPDRLGRRLRLRAVMRGAVPVRRRKGFGDLVQRGDGILGGHPDMRVRSVSPAQGQPDRCARKQGQRRGVRGQAVHRAAEPAGHAGADPDGDIGLGQGARL